MDWMSETESGKGSPLQLQALLDDRQREHFARYLLAEPHVRRSYAKLLQQKIRDPETSENERAMALDLLKFLKRRLRELKDAADKAYAEHRERRQELLGKSRVRGKYSRARDKPAQD